MEFTPGQALSHYRLIEMIGSGGMGDVWSAQDTKLKRNVAIKILPPDLTANAERKLRFQREAEMAAGLSHPNIAVIHEVGEHEGTPYLVMELLVGRTLRDIIGSKALPVSQWLTYAIPIASALAYAHKNGIVHRDLKSANVMVTDDGHVKLLDFGLAKLLEPDPQADSHDATMQLETISRELTQAGVVLGTVAYMSPEQARGDEVDHRSDIFSFGVLLYELVTGSFPFKGKTAIETLSATLSQDPPSVHELVDDLPGEAGRIVAKALEKEPQRRYQTADDMVTDFRNLKRDLGTGRVTIPGRGPLAETPAAAGGRRGARPWLIGAALVVVAAAIFGVVSQLGGSGGAGGDPTAVTATADPAEQPAEGSRIVVLPFENLGNPDDEYFASGVTEEIIGRLASVGDLEVISRSSSFQYDRTGKTMRQIGSDFAVDYILDGTVRWARGSDGSRVRISPQLVRVANDTGVWGETYDADMDDIFQVQTEIATQVIEALGVALVAGHSATSAERPTGNQDAYQAYLRGQDALAREPTGELAQQMFERAVEMDPDFHQAWAWLSRAHSWRHHGGDRDGGRCEAAKAAADEALRLAPDSPDSRMALGLYYYRCFRDYERALAQIELAGRGRPNDTDVLSWKATLNKRQGNLDESLRLYSRVLELDPMDHTSAQELGTVRHFQRDYAGAIEAYEWAISISPDVPGSYYFQTRVYLSWRGDTAAIRRVLDRTPAGDEEVVRWYRFLLEYYDGHYETALELAKDFPEASEDQTTLRVRAATQARCYAAMGDTARARTARAEAAALLQRKAEESPSDFRPYSDLGPILAALGRREAAIAAATRAVELMPDTKDAEAAVPAADNLALTYAILGDHDTARQLVAERLQARPGALSIPLMRLDPRWSGFVASPQFAELERGLESAR